MLLLVEDAAAVSTFFFQYKNWLHHFTEAHLLAVTPQNVQCIVAGILWWLCTPRITNPLHFPTSQSCYNILPWLDDSVMLCSNIAYYLQPFVRGLVFTWPTGTLPISLKPVQANTCLIKKHSKLSSESALFNQELGKLLLIFSGKKLTFQPEQMS